MMHDARCMVPDLSFSSRVGKYNCQSWPREDVSDADSRIQRIHVDEVQNETTLGKQVEKE